MSVLVFLLASLLQEISKAQNVASAKSKDIMRFIVFLLSHFLVNYSLAHLHKFVWILRLFSVNIHKSVTFELMIFEQNNFLCNLKLTFDILL